MYIMCPPNVNQQRLSTSCAKKKSKKKKLFLDIYHYSTYLFASLQNKQNDNVFCHGCWYILWKVTGNVTSPICQKFYALNIYFRSRSNKQAVGLMAQLLNILPLDLNSNGTFPYNINYNVRKVIISYKTYRITFSGKAKFENKDDGQSQDCLEWHVNG